MGTVVVRTFDGDIEGDIEGEVDGDCSGGTTLTVAVVAGVGFGGARSALFVGDTRSFVIGSRDPQEPTRCRKHRTTPDVNILAIFAAMNAFLKVIGPEKFA